MNQLQGNYVGVFKYAIQNWKNTTCEVRFEVKLLYWSIWLFVVLFISLCVGIIFSIANGNSDIFGTSLSFAFVSYFCLSWTFFYANIRYYRALGKQSGTNGIIRIMEGILEWLNRDAYLGLPSFLIKPVAYLFMYLFLGMIITPVLIIKSYIKVRNYIRISDV